MLNNRNNSLKYKFDFGNIFKLSISYIIEFIENIGLITLTWLALFFIIYRLLELLPDSLIRDFIIWTVTILMVLFDIFLIVLIFIPKRVWVKEDKILVNRFCIHLQLAFWDIRGFNDRIPYTEITVCQRPTRKIDYYGTAKPFFCLNEDSLVEIQTKHKTYLLPIKDCDSFVFEVNKRICENANK